MAVGTLILAAFDLDQRLRFGCDIMIMETPLPDRNEATLPHLRAFSRLRTPHFHVDWCISTHGLLTHDPCLATSFLEHLIFAASSACRLWRTAVLSLTASIPAYFLMSTEEKSDVRHQSNDHKTWTGLTHI